MKKRIIQITTFFILLIFCALSYPQSVNTKNLLDTYKDFYLWKEPKNNPSNSDSVLTVLGRWAWGPCQAVDTDSNFAYIGNGPTFHVLDISDPSSPEIVGEYLTDGYVYDIEVKDSVAFVSIGRGLLIIDISKPSLPKKISEVEIGGIAISLALDDTFVYVTTFSGVMWVVDISGINNPYKRGAIPAGGQLAFSVEAKDRYVYIGNPEYPPMVIVDANNPDTLSRVDFEVGGWGLSAHIKDTLLFIGVHGYYGTNYLKIYNISNASDPEFIGDVGIQAPEDIMAITVSKNGLIAYMVTTSGKVYSLDITNLTQPEIKGEYEKRIGASVGNTGIALTQSTLFAAYYSGLLSLDVSEPDSLKQRSFFPTGGFSEKIYLKNSIAFVASGLSGLWILDVSNPEKPKTISNINTGGFTADLVIEDTLAYIINWAAYSEQDTSRGLWIINIFDIFNPFVLSHYIGITNSSPVPNSITKVNSLILITQSPTLTSNDLVELIDVSNPFKPISTGIFQGNFIAHNTAVKDSIVFVSTSDRGLRLVNISNPFNPIEIGVFNDSTFLVGICVENNFAFADRIDTLFVLDISYPSNPIVIGKMGRNYGSFSSIDLFATDNFIYWAEGYLGVVDISDKTNPIDITRFQGRDWGRGVAAIGDKILFCDQTQGVWILRNNLVTNIKDDNPIITKYELYQNYPNPFNPSTTIEFKIPQNEKVLIEVFDVLGQRVKVLLNEEMGKGKHKISFNAVGLSSGIYFYRIRTKETTVTKKMVLLR
ncbi:MAG: T9SS type A sorting domain-containing protein [Bacteroidetes bacterium]|nr:T9SS type A sorting domain-containing protein [Bacteroidota bacterium]